MGGRKSFLIGVDCLQVKSVGFLLLSLVATPANASWRGLTWGMSRQQVAAIIPGFHEVTKRILGRDMKTDEAMAVKEGGCLMVPEFGFNPSSGLSVISLGIIADATSERLCANSVAQYYHRAYGQPSYYLPTEGDGTHTMLAKWRTSDSVIVFSFSDFFELDQVVLGVRIVPTGVTDPDGPTF